MHMLALARGGHVFSWGSGANGQLGHGTTESLSSPLLIRSLEEKGVCQIAAGGAHSAGLCDNGNLYMWGWNNSGQLGLEDVELRKIPTHATLFDDLEVSQVSCGLSHTAVLSRAERTVYTCGWNQYNQLGTGALWATRSEIPCKVDTCLLYTSDAADEEDSVDLGGRRIIEKKKRCSCRATARSYTITQR
eukprot:TRINITY_DN9984_c0_g1_i2.p1 TRINITY_DN9984_c0_g1~~TRINITY_DN9984_c0_g1_i2.p1  ORF type:complete len:190 (-),score=28.56 TRINITY_DN9984_c0_g1_i2:28-597(-)